MSVTLFGIKNCDTIKKARRYLDLHGVEYQFHDHRTDGVDKKVIQQWVAQHGWDTVLNKRGTTWRKLDDDTKQSTDAASAADLLCEHPAMIKRPILVLDQSSYVGFTEKSYDEILAKHGIQTHQN